MIGKYYESDELDCLFDTVYEAVGKELTDKGLVEMLQETPCNIMEVGDEFGLCDTVFNDMMFVWLRQIEGMEV